MRRRIDEFYDAVRAQDVDRIAAWFWPEARLRIYSASISGQTEFGGEFDGVAAIAGRFASFRQLWRIRELTVLDLVLDGSKGAARLSMHADARSMRRTFSTQSTHFLAFRDERIVDLEVFIQEMAMSQPADRLAAPSA